MAGKTGRQIPVIEALASRPRDFAFIQAVRLLSHQYMRDGRSGDFFTDFLRMRADLSLGFPESDLTGLEYLPEGADRAETEKVRLTATFFGLYGSSSPLPTFYTEELLEERSEDESVQRDFLDIPGQALYSLYLAEFFRHRLMDKVVSLGRTDEVERLFCLAGLGHPEIRKLFAEPMAMIRVAGLLSQFPRSASGLRCILMDRFKSEVSIDQCVPDRPPIPPDQRCRLGTASCSLGDDIRLGAVADDCLGRIRITINDLKLETFQALCPGGGSYRKLKGLVNFYCSDPLEFDLTLKVKDGEGQSARLGDLKSARLGMGAWLGRGEVKNGQAFFPGSALNKIM
ncbi:MAG: type VI secretion system baseplate subunit TssG [Candidatus Adiutrix sp.]|jgi:type VI secretion system protein ImpH|nr:type VI secretion system baseplate subunit TssG [Candidatus Adiutrix sp.]